MTQILLWHCIWAVVVFVALWFFGLIAHFALETYVAWNGVRRQNKRIRNLLKP